MTKKEYLERIAEYIKLHWDGEVREVRVEADGSSMLLRVNDDVWFLDWWDVMYVPLDSWMHEHDFDVQLTTEGIRFV